MAQDNQRILDAAPGQCQCQDGNPPDSLERLPPRVIGDLPTELYQSCGARLYRLLLKTISSQVIMSDGVDLETRLTTLERTLAVNTTLRFADDLRHRDALTGWISGDKVYVSDAAPEVEGGAMYLRLADGWRMIWQAKAPLDLQGLLVAGGGLILDETGKMAVDFRAMRQDDLAWLLAGALGIGLKIEDNLLHVKLSSAIDSEAEDRAATPLAVNLVRREVEAARDYLDRLELVLAELEHEAGNASENAQRALLIAQNAIAQGTAAREGMAEALLIAQAASDKADSAIGVNTRQDAELAELSENIAASREAAQNALDTVNSLGVSIDAAGLMADANREALERLEAAQQDASENIADLTIGLAETDGKANQALNASREAAEAAAAAQSGVNVNASAIESLAAQNASALASLRDDALLKIGGTMTGELDLAYATPRIKLKDAIHDISNPPASKVNGPFIDFCDQNGKRFFCLNGTVYPDGGTGVDYYLFNRDAAGREIYSALRYKLYKDGRTTFSSDGGLDLPADSDGNYFATTKWVREAIASLALLKSGGTISGTLRVAANTPWLTVQNLAMDLSKNPASKQNGPYLDYRDKNNQRVGCVSASQYADGSTALVMSAINLDAAGNVLTAELTLKLARDGTATLSASRVEVPPASNDKTFATTAWVRDRIAAATGKGATTFSTGQTQSELLALAAEPEQIASRNEAQAVLEALDSEYLTPRTLAGLSVNDAVAVERYEEHESLAQGVREVLASLPEDASRETEDSSELDNDAPREAEISSELKNPSELKNSPESEISSGFDAPRETEDFFELDSDAFPQGGCAPRETENSSESEISSEIPQESPGDYIQTGIASRETENSSELTTEAENSTKLTDKTDSILNINIIDNDLTDKS